ncbi:hypothetical protein [Gordonia sp. NPDC003950]
MSDDVAQRLLDAQIAFTRRQLLTPAEYGSLVVEAVDAFLDDAATLTLDDVVTRELIKLVAHKYTVQMPVEGSIPELVGEIGGRIYRHRANDEYRLADIADPAEFDALVAAITDTGLVRRLATQVIESPAAMDACVELVTQTLDAAIEERRADGETGGVRAALIRAVTRVAAPAVPVLESGVERVARIGMRRLAMMVERDGDDVLGAAARELWRERSAEVIGRFRDVLEPGDVEDLVVVAFEFWKSFRDTDYFRPLLDEGIDHVFDKYGTVALTDLLADLGIGRADLIEEGLRFGPVVLTRLDERGMLEPLLRRQFAPFYSSPEFQAALRGDGL